MSEPVKTAGFEHRNGDVRLSSPSSYRDARLYALQATVTRTGYTHYKLP